MGGGSICPSLSMNSLSVCYSISPNIMGKSEFKQVCTKLFEGKHDKRTFNTIYRQTITESKSTHKYDCIQSILPYNVRECRIIYQNMYGCSLSSLKGGLTHFRVFMCENSHLVCTSSGENDFSIIR